MWKRSVMYLHHNPNQNYYYYGEAPYHPDIMQDSLIASDVPLVSVDVESISLRERIAVGIGFCPAPDTAFYFPLFPNQSSSVPWHLLKGPAVAKVFHNTLFDLGCLWEYDIDWNNIKDTSVMSRLLMYEYNSLVDLSAIHQREVHDMKEYLVDGKKTTLDLTEELLARKCCQDVIATYRLYQLLLPKTSQPYFNTEMQIIPICDRMSRKGIKLDQERRSQLEVETRQQVDFLRGVCEEEGFNPGSPQQAGYMLAKRGAYGVFHKLPFTKSKTRGKPRALSTAKETLQRMDDPMATIILQYRHYASLLSDYLVPWTYDDRAYTHWHLDAATGRPSSSDRNLQNIPGVKNGSQARSIFLPDSGIWTDFDFSQLELRILAHLSGDKEMQYIFSLPKYNQDGTLNLDADLHQQTANFMGIGRRIAKNVGFSMIYGATATTIMETAELKDIRKAEALKQSWFDKFPQAGDWIQGQQYRAVANGYITTLYGRNIRLPQNEDEDAVQRKGVNYPIQASAAEILKRSLINCKDLDLALQVHDQLLADGFVPEIRLRELEHISPLYTPIEISYLDRWE